MFLVVQFHCAGGTLELVPQSWFNKLSNSCWWPDEDDSNEVYKLITSPATCIGETWSLYDAECLGTFSKLQLINLLFVKNINL